MTPTCFVRIIPWVRLAVLAALPGGAWAQGITVDGRLSPAQTLAGPNYAIGPGLGRQVGGNLFHSFGAFGLKQGETATFSGPPSVGNVIGRVTGGTASSIDGGIKSTISGANLYLINPASVVFGPNASVDVSGSFHASSADYLRMKDGAQFGATNPDVSTLSAAPPEAFGFLSANPQPVAVNGSNLQLKQGSTQAGNTLGLVGGDVTISGGVLLAPGGTVHIVSAAGPGEVPVDPRAGPAPTVARSGRVQVANKANINVDGASTGADGGSVYIRAGDLSLKASTITADNRGLGSGGALSLHGDRSATLSNGTSVRASASGTGHGPEVGIGTAAGGMVTLDLATVSTTAAAGAGNGGPVAINTGTLTLRNGAVVLSGTAGSGAGGPISVAADSVLLDGAGTRLFSQTTGAGPAGAGGSIALSGGTLTVQNGASVQASTSGGGTGGAISAGMTGNVAVSTGAQILSSSDTAGASSRVTAARGSQGGDAGAVTLRAGALSLLQGGSIKSVASASGNAGDVALNVGGALMINAAGNGGSDNGVSSETNDGSSGLAGAVRVSAGSVSVLNGGFITSRAGGTGSATLVVVTTPGALLLDSGGAATGFPFTGIAAQASGTQSGNAGTVTINAGSISILNGSDIDSSAGGIGSAGSVVVMTPGALLLDSQGAQSASAFTGISAQAIGAQSGNAGTITVNAGTLAVQGGAEISNGNFGPGRSGDITVNAGSISVLNQSFIVSSTEGAGSAGSVVVTTPGALLLDGQGAGAFVSTGIAARADGARSGNAGTVTVNAGRISVVNGGVISSSTVGTSSAGSVMVTTPGTLLLDGQGAAAPALTGIAAQASGAQSGNAGSVTVNAGTLALQDGARISSSTSGPGNAGTVMVGAGTIAVQGGARITSSTTGPDRGGNVSVAASSDIRLDGPGPQIRATSASAGSAGSITVAAPRVALRDGASISTEALRAAGGNITVGPGDLLYLQRSSITTSVSGASGNGGNITVDPQLVVLDRSTVQANAVGGNGGNVQVRANQLVQSFDSAITASSQRGVSGQIFVAAQPLNLNGSLVVLASELRAAATLLREGCAVRGAAPRSSLVAAGRGGQRQDLEATLPALYFAHRPVPDGAAPAAAALTDTPARISLGLSSACG